MTKSVDRLSELPVLGDIAFEDGLDVKGCAEVVIGKEKDYFEFCGVRHVEGPVYEFTETLRDPKEPTIPRRVKVKNSSTMRLLQMIQP